MQQIALEEVRIFFPPFEAFKSHIKKIRKERNQMCKIKKVSELEWYLSIRAFLDTMIPENPNQGPEMSLDSFRCMWEHLPDPTWISDKAFIVRSPLSIHVLLAPCEDLVLPLGYILPKKMEYLQSDAAIHYASGTIDGTMRGKGNTIRITNTTEEPQPLDFNIGDPIAIAVTGDIGGMDWGVSAFCVHLPCQDVLFRIPELIWKSEMIPVNTQKELIQKDYYLSVVKDKSIYFCIQYAIKGYKNPLRDPVIDCIYINDISKYKIHLTKRGPVQCILNAPEVFRSLWELASDGEGIEKKKYLVN